MPPLAQVKFPPVNKGAKLGFHTLPPRCTQLPSALRPQSDPSTPVNVGVKEQIKIQGEWKCSCLDSLSLWHHHMRCQLGHRLHCHPAVNDLAKPARSESYLYLISTRLYSYQWIILL